MHVVQYVLLPPAAVGKDKTLQLGETVGAWMFVFRF